MRRGQFTISAGSVTHCAVHWLVEALQWPVTRGKIAPEFLVRLLVRAAAQLRSLYAIVSELGEAPSMETVRLALHGFLPSEPADLLPATTRALHSRLPKRLLRRPRNVAVDLHLRPYYGMKNTRGIYRGQPKASTKTFFAYATLLVLRRGQTFTLGLTHVINGEEQTAILERLLAQARQAGLQIRRIFLDRGFYAATTMRWLQQQELAFIMPVIRRGKTGRKKSDCTGTAQFFVRGRRGWDQYTWTARPRRCGRKQAAVTVTIDVCMVPKSRDAGGRKGKKKKGSLVFASHGKHLSLDQVAQWYRKRFRIETSYRQLGQGLAATCSKNPVYRLLIVAIALVLRNLWVWLHYCLAERCPQGLHLRLQCLTVLKMMSWLVAILNKVLDIRPQALTIDPQLTNVTRGGR